MRGEVRAGALRPARTPVRERVATWIDARVRKRRADRQARAVLMARLAAERRAALRAGRARPRVVMTRRPY